MGKRVKKALAAFAAAAATGDPAAVSQYEAEMAAFNAKQGTKKGGLFGHAIGKYNPKNLKNSILNPKIGIRDIGDTGRAGFKGSLKDRRANLRAHHEKTIHPFNSTSQAIIKSDAMIRSGDPNVVQQGRVLRKQADDKSLRNGKTGIAVGLAFWGAGAASSVGTGSIVPDAATLGKEVGAAGVAQLKQNRADAQDASNGIADTSLPNGQGFEPGYGGSDRSVVSSGYNDFFNSFSGGSAAAGAGAGATSCAAAGNGDPWMFCIGLALILISISWKIYGHVRHKT